jgi:hypothetical protein
MTTAEKAIQTYTEAAFVLAVVGAAQLPSPFGGALAAIVGAAFLVGLAWLADRRSVPKGAA